MTANKEWAIQDEATGEWWTGACWRAAGPDGNVWGNYRHVCAALAGTGCITFEEGRTPRIVPAPPREMTDAEAIAWAHGQNISLSGSKQSIVWDVYHFNGGKLAWGLTLFDAIRAARRNLESK